jgi:hypothetical protein
MGFLEYLNFRKSNTRFNETPTIFPPTITTSLLAIPYITHNDNPTINDNINQTDKSSIFFVLRPLTICGTVLERANMLAIMPIMDIKKSNMEMYFPYRCT